MILIIVFTNKNARKMLHRLAFINYLGKSPFCFGVDLCELSQGGRPPLLKFQDFFIFI